jgi:hypothetical protein
MVENIERSSNTAETPRTRSLRRELSFFGGRIDYFNESETESD